MSKICCIEKGVSPKASSCSMILRSSCSHGHSHEKLNVNEHSSSSHKRNHNSLIASKSSKSRHSLINGRFHETIEVNHKSNQRVLEVSSINLSCAKELNFSQLSTDSQIFNNLNHTECSSDYCSATESDINSNELLDSALDMNKRRYVKSPHPSARTLSDSEGESDITVERISRLTRRSLVSKEYSYNRNLASQKDNNSLSHNNVSYVGNHSNSINSHTSNYTGSSHGETSHSYMTGTSHGETAHSFMTDSSHLDSTSSVKYSLFDRFRLFFRKCTYSNLIRYTECDVWLLSRIRDTGKAKLISLLLLPLIFFLVVGTYRSSPALYESISSVNNLFSTIISSFLSLLSSVYSFICILFTRKAVEYEVVSNSSDESGFLTFLPSFGALFSGWFSRAIIETKYDYIEKRSHKLEDDVSSSQSHTEVLLALSSLKDELKEIKSSFHQLETKESMHQTLHKDMKDLHLKLEMLSKTVDAKEKDSLEKYQKEKTLTDEKILVATNEYKNHMDHLKNKLQILENKLAAYEDLKKCCSKQWNQEDLAALIEKSLILAFKEVLGGDMNSKYNFFSEWLNSKFFNHEKMMQEINASLKEHSSYTEAKVDFSKVSEVIESTVIKHVDVLKKNLSEFNNFGFTMYNEDSILETIVRRIVKEQIKLYDADKTGLVDFALESGGGSVLGTRCSETYNEKYGKMSLLGMPLWTYSNSPRTAIQPGVHPGECWAFKGSQGFLVLQLSATIYPTGFTLEHIPESVSPAGSIDSAPKNFSVWGLDSEKDNKGNLLGEYFYDIHGEPLQYFPVKVQSSKPYSYVELQIHSNHGNMEYTCLYRFRVHGERATI